MSKTRDLDSLFLMNLSIRFGWILGNISSLWIFPLSQAIWNLDGKYSEITKKGGNLNFAIKTLFLVLSMAKHPIHGYKVIQVETKLLWHAHAYIGIVKYQFEMLSVSKDM